MANYRIYVGSKRGKALGDGFELMQGSTESALIFEVYTEDDAVYNFAAGATIAGYFLDIGDDPSDPPDVYTTTGTITPDIGANTFTWEPSAADVGQPGDYNLTFKLIAADADADYTFPIHYKLRETPDGTLVPAVGLVGVTPAEAAWLTLALAENPTPEAWLPKDTGILSKSANYDIASGDEGKLIECTGTFAITAPDGLDTGFQVVLVNVGVGIITVAADTTLQAKGAAYTLADQYGAAVLYHRGSNVWLLFGDLT